MSRFKKEVKAIIKDHDARDPRGALLAIERLLDAKITGPKELLRVTVKRGELPGELVCDLKHNPKKPALTAIAIGTALGTIGQFVINKVQFDSTKGGSKCLKF